MLLDRRRPRVGLDRAGHQQEPARVPELVRELAALVDLLRVEADVLRRGHLEQAVPQRVGALLLDRVDRVDAGAERLRHAPAVGREQRRVDDHVGERHLAEQLEPREDHAVLPEPDDLARGRLQRAGIERGEVGRLVGPAERRERPQLRREPRVEHVGLAAQLGRAALGASGRIGLGDGDVVVGAVPDGQLVPPPDLAGDVPVGRVLERRDREAVLRLGVVHDLPRVERLDRRLLDLVHPAPPLQRDERLDAVVAALARRHRVAVALALLDLAALGRPREDALLGLVLREAGELARGVVHPAVGPDHGELGKAVVAADREVGRVVARA